MMNNLFLIMIVLCFPGLWIAVPRIADALYWSMQKAGYSVMSQQKLKWVLAGQSIIFVIIAAAIGVHLGPWVGLQDQFLSALADQRIAVVSFWIQLQASLYFGIPCSIVFLLVYYMYFRPRLVPRESVTFDHLRISAGLWGRLLYGAVVEEVICRWGLQTLCTWVVMRLTGYINPFIYWLGIFVSSFVFIGGHVPGFRAAGCRSLFFIVMLLVLNLWSFSFYGWLFWQYGLIAAIGAHMVLHLMWIPVELCKEQKNNHLILMAK